ncbi:mutator type transposase [Tanacetum coccineum]|uniref:Mutator type transposase n=1 Tax=Tanacetum coccineum TaxID=301880 RepID=A0ABQ5CVD9_9ASTR
MVKLSVDLNEPKDSSKTDKATQNGRTPKSLTLEIHHGGWFTPTPSRSYIVDSITGLDYGLHSLNVDADVLEMSKYVKDYKIILVYVKHGSSIFVTPKKGVSIAVNNHLRKGPIEFDNSPDICLKNPFEELDDIEGEYAHIGKQITRNEITGNEITGNEITRNESTGNEITGKQMVVHVGNSSTVDDVLELGMLFETEEVGPVGKFKEMEVDANNESEEESDTEGDYTMDSDSEDLDYDPKHDDVFTADPKHDTSIGGVDVQDDDLDVIDYDSFGSDLDDGIDSERKMQLRELRRIGKQKNKDPNKVRVRCQGIIPALVPYVAIDNNTDKNVFSQTKGGPAIRENINSGKQNILGKDKTVEGKDHVIKSLATNPDIPVRAVQDQMQKQFEVGVSKMKAFRAKRIASDIMTGSYREQYSLLREYAQELINQNPGTTVRIDVQQEPNPESLTRTFRRVYVCLGALKQAVGVDTNNRIYPVAYALVEAESKASWCWFLNLLGEDLSIEANFNYTFIYDRQKVCVRHIHENMKSQFKGGRAKCDLLINNICEVFNRQLVDGRDQPIITCLEYIKEYLMKRIVKGCRGQGGGSSQAGARKVSGQAASATNVSGQAAGSRKVSGQAAGATNISGQAAGARKVSGQAADARKASSQPSIAQSIAKQGPKQGFQGLIAGPASGSQRKTKKLVDL